MQRILTLGSRVAYRAFSYTVRLKVGHADILGKYQHKVGSIVP